MVLTDKEIRDVIAAGNYIPESAKKHMTQAEFDNKYGLKALEGYTKSRELLYFLFGTKGQNKDSLAYSLESQHSIIDFYAPAKPGYAYNKILNYSHGKWMKYNEEISEDQAIETAYNIRTSLIAALKAVDSTMDAVQIGEVVKKQALPVTEPWLRKYLTILYPDRFMPMSNTDWTSRLFVPLGLKQDGDNWFANAKVFSEKAGTFGLDPISFYHAVHHCVTSQVKAELISLGIDPAQLASEDNLMITTPEAWKAKKEQIEDAVLQTQFGDFLAQRYGWDPDKLVKKRGRKAAAAVAPAPAPAEAEVSAPLVKDVVPEHVKEFAKLLKKSKNVIFRGAPGTGKSYLARQIAACIVTNGSSADYEGLTAEEKNQTGFVQFHPSYDYSDFVEGLRPCAEDGTLGFKLRKGTFKEFVDRARANFENAEKSIDTIRREATIEEKINTFLEESAEKTFKTERGSEFTVQLDDEQNITVSIPKNEIRHTLTVKLDDVRKLLESEQPIESVKDVVKFFGRKHNAQEHSYLFVIYKEINKSKVKIAKDAPSRESRKDFVFIIDEINRGEISKILGELFYSIEPSKRGKKGGILTQYANLHRDPKEEFYIPENVYIIGTMNDIDRSVDTFDFAMRRRFRFVEINANRCVDMLDAIGAKKDEAIRRMKALNEVIEKEPDLGKNYQIGAAYFMQLRDVDYTALWEDYLEPLLQEYVNGTGNEKETMNKFKKAYNSTAPVEELNDESAG